MFGAEEEEEEEESEDGVESGRLADDQAVGESSSGDAILIEAVRWSNDTGVDGNAGDDRDDDDNDGAADMDDAPDDDTA